MKLLLEKEFIVASVFKMHLGASVRNFFNMPAGDRCPAQKNTLHQYWV